ncbi:MAG: hypothetical protein SWH61_03310 [Thermodesulfobacteriota bacterium]|nr:hypothetical protein [Thermodesulfobacteriota bacterium]
MPRIQVDDKQLSQATRDLMILPGLFSRARRSALKSVGYMVQQTLRNHVEYGGAGWPALHPLTRMFKHKYGAKGRWIKRSFHEGPLFWLGKFARYRVEDQGDTVKVHFGKSKKGQKGTFNKELVGIVDRAERGETIRVTPKMRRFLAATRRRRPKSQEPGGTYFPLKKTTKTLKTPARPIFSPVWRKVRPTIMPLFEKKFNGALDRYLLGTKKT